MRWHEKGIVKKMKMQIKKIEGDFTVCKVVDFSEVNFEAEYCFTAKTDEENSVVCRTEDVPKNTIDGRTDGELFG